MAVSQSAFSAGTTQFINGGLFVAAAISLVFAKTLRGSNGYFLAQYIIVKHSIVNYLLQNGEQCH